MRAAYGIPRSSSDLENVTSSGKRDGWRNGASWTAEDNAMTSHLEAVAETLAFVAGLPPVGVTNLSKHH